ncbi:MAG: UDP-glucose/GDP-mannose dehydrogenase family protein [Pedobacter sp.]|nr:UDP-glucose/GDP-mannose dehydrogenase family protein [Pedobacter sp.]
MNIAVIGTGYVGLVTGACFAEMGNQVVCVDQDRQKISALGQGDVLIHEPGLEDIVRRNLAKGRLSFTTRLELALQSANIIFIAVGTPQKSDGCADTGHVLEVATKIGETLSGPATICIKSTVPVGTTEKVDNIIRKALARRRVNYRHDIASNPEFLREGSAIHDFMCPDRVIVGCHSKRAARIMRQLYEPCLKDSEHLLIMGLRESELSKYAANAMLATRISFINEIALIAEELNADIEEIQRGIGSDRRIGPHFLKPGCGYGGSCFPKYVRALVNIAKQNGIAALLLGAVDERNEAQKQILHRKLENIFEGDLGGRRIAILGLAFKPETDDLREAPAIALIHQLHASGANIAAHDPAANAAARMLQSTGLLPSSGLEILDDIEASIRGADALVLVTEWPQFKQINFHRARQLMHTPVIIDGRNLLDADALGRLGFLYSGVARKASSERTYTISAKQRPASEQATLQS